jgi:hypothetical protein
MGNVQCTPEDIGFDQQTEERVRSFAAMRPQKSVGLRSSAAKSDFLTVHLEERPEKCIVGYQDVVEALVQQTMELIRREKEDISLSSDSVSDDCEEEDDVYSVNGVSSVYAPSDATVENKSSAYAPSEVTGFTAMSGATTDTKATLVANNRDHYVRRKKRTTTTAGTPVVMGTAFHAKPNVHGELRKAILKMTKEDTEFKRLSKLVTALDGTQGCALIPAALMHEPLPDDLGEKAREYMSVLQLRIKPRFADFFQSHLSRLLPDSPFTRAVSQGIALSRLSPTKNRDSPRPSLMRTNSDSTASSSADIGFGEGPPSNPVRLLATDLPFADLGITGSLGLADRKRQSRNRSPSSGIKPPSHYIVLLNRRSGVPLAVCALKTATTGPPVVRMYATKRRMFGQRMAASTKKLGLDWSESYPLYPWAEIVTEGRYPSRVRYSIYLASGNDGRFEELPSYRAEHASVGSPEIRVVGRTERESQQTGCAILSLCRQEGNAEEDDLFLNLSISKGVDPALMVCFAAFVDEAMEKTMRQQCQALSENIYRR